MPGGLLILGAAAYLSLSFILGCEGDRVMSLFVVVLALAVIASTQAMAVAPLHQRHAKIREQIQNTLRMQTGNFANSTGEWRIAQQGRI
jgi:membrane protein YdbS with pleckstrin-like domain